MNDKHPPLTAGQKAGAYAITHILKETVTALAKESLKHPRGQCARTTREAIEEATRLVITSVCTFVKLADNPEDAACTIKIQATQTINQIDLALTQSCDKAHKELYHLPKTSKAKRQNNDYFTGKGQALIWEAATAAVKAYEDKPENGREAAESATLRLIAPEAAKIRDRSKKAKRPREAADEYAVAAINAKSRTISAANRMLDWIAETAMETALQEQKDRAKARAGKPNRAA